MNLQLCNSPTLLAVGYAAAQPLTRRVNAQVVYPHESPNICTQRVEWMFQVALAMPHPHTLRGKLQPTPASTSSDMFGYAGLMGKLPDEDVLGLALCSLC